MALTPEMEKIVRDNEAWPVHSDINALCAEVRRLDAALEAAEAALRKERERAERWKDLASDAPDAFGAAADWSPRWMAKWEAALAYEQKEDEDA